MAVEDLTFNTTAGQTVARHLMVAYLNVGANETPEWAAFGKRVADSDMEMDWGQDTVQDILGDTFTTMKKPTKTQTFDPIPLDAGDKVAQKLWNLAVREENAQALSSMDMMVAHFYVGAEKQNFAERYPSSAIAVTRYGGEGGGNLTFGTEVTYGGTRVVGTVAKDPSGKVTFTPAGAGG